MVFAFIEAKRESLDRRSGRSRRRFSAGRAKQSGNRKRLNQTNREANSVFHGGRLSSGGGGKFAIRNRRFLFSSVVDPLLRYQCPTVTPVFNAVHKRHAPPYGIGCVIEDDDLKRLVRCLNGDGHAVQDMSDGLHVLVSPAFARSRTGAQNGQAAAPLSTAAGFLENNEGAQRSRESSDF